MTAKTLKGGAHPPEHKNRTKDLPIEKAYPSTKTVWIPLLQGCVENKPIVKVGDKVAKGQKIAESDAYLAVPIHSSISGVVKRIQPHLATGNVDALCIVIEDDGSNDETKLEVLDPFACTIGTAIERIKAAGIVGMGGAAFPTHIKLSPSKDTKIDYIIANGAECEPYLTIDDRLMQENANKIVDGLAIAMRVTGAKEGIIAIETNKKHLVPSLEKAIKNQRAVPVAAGAYSIGISLCKTKYPQGGEKMLIKTLLNREVPSGCFPSAAGCVVQNVSTLKAISEAFREGKPLTERCLTLTGGACENPQNLEVPIGTLVGDLIPEVIQLHPGVVKIISGGLMMGVAMKSANFPVQKNTSGVLFLTKNETSLEEESPCINCGECIRHCSCRLAPVLMSKALDAGDLDRAIKNGLIDCTECGTCAYVCPANQQLVQRFRVGKQLVQIRDSKDSLTKTEQTKGEE